MTKLLLPLLLLVAWHADGSRRADNIFPGADEKTPSRSEYFTWINNDNEGSTERQTLINLDFFKWLHDEYGMQLDIYAFDAGNVDGSFGTYGNLESTKFHRQFPHGFEPISKAARSMGTRWSLVRPGRLRQDSRGRTGANRNDGEALP